MSETDEISISAFETIPTPIEPGNISENDKNFAQNMTESIYQVHSAVNDVLMGNASDSVETVETVETEEAVEVEKALENISSSSTTTTTATSATTTTITHHLAKEQIKYCQRILKGLKRHRDSSPFLLPVDPVALNIPDYLTVIKHPMDLSTVSKKMELGEYATAEAFMADVRLMLNNCFTYNAPDSGVAKMGRSLEKYFNASMAKMPVSEADLLSSAASGMTESSPSTASSSATAAAANAASLEAERRQRRESKPVASMGSVGRFTAPETFSFCSGVLRELMKKTNAHLNWPFMMPVDPVALNIPDYLEIIKNPMDLSTIRKKLDSKVYGSMEQFEEDVRLLFSNCYTYNPPESDVHKMGRQLEAIFDSKWAAKPQPKSAKPAAERRSSASVSGVSGSASTSASNSASSFHSLPQQLSVSNLVPLYESIEDDSEKILAINYQIQLLQAELNNLLLKRKSPYSSAASSSGSISASNSAPAKSRAPAQKKKSVTSPLQSTLTGSAVADSSTSSSSSASASSSLPKPFSNDEMTFEEKKKLSEDVGTLAPEQLMRVLDIIEKCMPNLHKNLDSEIIELDIEALDTYTLRVMQAYIWECMNPGKKRKPAQATNAPLPKKEKIIPGTSSNNSNIVSVSIASTDDESSSDEE